MGSSGSRYWDWCSDLIWNSKCIHVIDTCVNCFWKTQWFEILHGILNICFLYKNQPQFTDWCQHEQNIFAALDLVFSHVFNKKRTINKDYITKNVKKTQLLCHIFWWYFQFWECIAQKSNVNIDSRRISEVKVNIRAMLVVTEWWVSYWKLSFCKFHNFCSKFANKCQK